MLPIVVSLGQHPRFCGYLVVLAILGLLTYKDIVSGFARKLDARLVDEKHRHCKGGTLLSRTHRFDCGFVDTVAPQSAKSQKS